MKILWYSVYYNLVHFERIDKLFYLKNDSDRNSVLKYMIKIMYNIKIIFIYKYNKKDMNKFQTFNILSSIITPTATSSICVYCDMFFLPSPQFQLFEIGHSSLIPPFGTISHILYASTNSPLFQFSSSSTFFNIIP